MKTYRVNEVFYSLQGEGIRAGTPNIFVRFSGCNLACDVEPGPKSPGGFACDTEFASGRTLTLEEIAEWAAKSWEIATGLRFDTDDARNDGVGLRSCASWKVPWLILTGGEPGLQVDDQFIQFWHGRGCLLAIETNGTIELPPLLDWITLSPKVAEHAVKQLWANELKYVRGYGQGIPKPVATAEHYLISPAFDGLNLSEETLKWCTKLVLENPQWRLSVQQHKQWKLR